MDELRVLNRIDQVIYESSNIAEVPEPQGDPNMEQRIRVSNELQRKTFKKIVESDLMSAMTRRQLKNRARRTGSANEPSPDTPLASRRTDKAPDAPGDASGAGQSKPSPAMLQM
ncbi:hypothetical protein PI125_g7312 [Phytophthora idaei]|nr:hypothetical protein PI125_g7312 [Phytophthora idaei]